MTPFVTSREAGQDYSPRRKAVGGQVRSQQAPGGAKGLLRKERMAQ